MPEIAEVETLRRDLEPVLVGRTIVDCVATGERSVRRHEFLGELATLVCGAQVTGLRRVGKYLLIDAVGDTATSDPLVIMIHLRMSGQVFHVDRSAQLAKHTHVRVGLDGNDEIRFVDPRTFGEVFACRSVDFDRLVPSVAAMGWDPLASPVSKLAFGRQVASVKRHAKAFLLDQRQVAGLGNIYTDEVLFAAKVRHDRRTNSLTPREVGRMYRAILALPADAANNGGSSLRDQQYRRLYGEIGGYQHHLQVFDRASQPCFVCGRVIERAAYGGRSTFFCGHCQH